MENEKIKGDVGKTIPIPKMASSSHDQSIPSATISRSDDSKQLKRINGGGSPPSSSTKKPDELISNNVNKAKSCKGCLYYSSRFKADSRKPVCVGLTRSLTNVPGCIVGQSELEASKEGRSLTDFRYACIGYSLYVDQKGHGSNGQGTQKELPVCAGLEVLVDRRVNNADTASAPTMHIHNRECKCPESGNGLPQRQLPKPINSTGEDYFSRFTRNANLVANGVAKNMRRVGNQIKQSLDDIMYRRRPK